MATSIPQDFALLQKRRVRARVLSLSFVATIILSIVVGPSWLYTVKLGPFDAPITGVIGFLSFPLSVFFFGVALKYVKLQKHLTAPVRIQPEGLAKSLKSSSVRLVFWVLFFLSSFFAVSMVAANPTMGLASLIPILVFTPIIWVFGLFGSALEFNNNRALRIMLSWASAEATPETQASNL